MIDDARSVRQKNCGTTKVDATERRATVREMATLILFDLDTERVLSVMTAVGYERAEAMIVYTQAKRLAEAYDISHNA